MYNITSYTAQNEGTVVDCYWTYTTADGSVSGKHVLATPAGVTPAADLTEEVLVGWLAAQLPNTSEEFDAAIAQRKQEQEYNDSLTAFVNNGGNFEPVVEVVESEVVEAAE